MFENPIFIFVAALVPIAVGFIYYNPKVMGTAWMNACKFSEDDLKGGNMPVIFGLSIVFSILLSFGLSFSVIHQLNLMGLFMADADFAAGKAGAARDMHDALMAEYGTAFRTFKHGFLHGVMTSIFLALPIVGINALFEQRGFKYLGIHLLYWVITLGLMGGILSAYL